MQGEAILERKTEDGIATITFGHSKSNSLPRILLYSLAEEIEKAGMDPSNKVIVLQSVGDKTFCAGASFDELLEVDTPEKGRGFFSGFARVLLAMKRCPKFIIARVQGKVAGGGGGIVCAADYALAVEDASVRLSELAIGIAPFTIGPAVQRKIGLAAFNEMAISADWRSAAWCRSFGMFAELYPTIHELDAGVAAFAKKLASYSPIAMQALKKVLWEGTENWEELLDTRVSIVSSMVLSDFAQNAIQKAKQGQR